MRDIIYFCRINIKDGSHILWSAINDRNYHNRLEAVVDCSCPTSIRVETLIGPQYALAVAKAALEDYVRS